MLCLQTSCHRCPSALHNRLVTSTPSLSSTTYAPTRRRSRRRRGHSHRRANRGRRAKNAGVATGRAAAAACRWRKNASSITATPELAAMAYWRGRADRRRAKNESTPPVRRRRDTRIILCFIELPTEDPPRERDTSAAAPGPPSSRAPSRVSPRPRPASPATPRRTRSPSPRPTPISLRPSARRLH